MFDRNQLVHLVLWPQGQDAVYELYGPDGEFVAVCAIKEPVKGDALARMVPKGFSVDVSNCAVLTMSGDPVVATKAQFDTAVVTERAVIDMETRLLNLERRERARALAAERKEQERQQAFEARMKELEAGEPVVEPGDAEPPQAATEPSEGGDDNAPE